MPTKTHLRQRAPRPLLAALCLLALCLLASSTGTAFAAPHRADHDWARPGIPDDSPLGQVLAETVTSLDRGLGLPDRTFLFVRALRTRWDGDRPITVAQIQDVYVQRNQDYVLQRTTSVSKVVFLLGPLFWRAAYKSVNTGHLELDARIEFFDSRHEVEIEGLLPKGGVVPLAVRRGEGGVYVPQVTVVGRGRHELDGVLLPVLDRFWAVEDVMPFLYWLQTPTDWLSSSRKWNAALRRARKEGHDVPQAELRRKLVEQAAFDELSAGAVLEFGERAIEAQRRREDTPADRLGLVRIFGHTGRHSAAWPLVQPLLDELPELQSVRVELAQVAYLADQKEAAWTILEPALAHDPDILTLALCERLQRAAVPRVVCPADPNAGPPAPAAGDPMKGDGVDEELAQFEREGREAARTRREVLSRRYRHPQVRGVHVDALEAMDQPLLLEFAVTLADVPDVEEVEVFINPKRASWRSQPATRDGDTYRATLPTKQQDTRGIYWYVVVKTEHDQYRLGSPTSAFTIDP